MARKSYHHGNLRQTLIEAGIALIAERGADGFNMRELARRAEVSPGAPYRHFTDKDDLLATVATQGFEQLIGQMQAATAAAANPTMGFRRQGEVYTEFAIANPAHFRAMYLARLRDADRFPGLLQAQADANAAVRTQIVAAMKSGGVAPFDEQHIALAALALVYGTARLFVDGVLPAGEDGAIARHVGLAITEVFGLGIVPRPSVDIPEGVRVPSLAVDLLPTHAGPQSRSDTADTADTADSADSAGSLEDRARNSAGE